MANSDPSVQLRDPKNPRSARISIDQQIQEDCALARSYPPGEIKRITKEDREKLMEILGYTPKPKAD